MLKIHVNKFSRKHYLPIDIQVEYPYRQLDVVCHFYFLLLQSKTHSLKHNTSE